MSNVSRSFKEIQELRQQVNGLEKRVHSGGGSGYNDGMWEQTVEQRLGQLHQDLRGLLKMGTAATAFLLLAFGAGWLDIDRRLDGLDKDMMEIKVLLQERLPAAKPQPSPESPE